MPNRSIRVHRQPFKLQEPPVRNAAELLMYRLEALQANEYADAYLLPHLGKHYIVFVDGKTMNIYNADYGYVPASLILLDGSELHVFIDNGVARIVGCS